MSVIIGIDPHKLLHAACAIDFRGDARARPRTLSRRAIHRSVRFKFAAQLGIDKVPEPRLTAILADVHPRQEVVTALWADIVDGKADSVQPLLDAALVSIACPYLAIYGSQLTKPACAAVDQTPNVTVEVWDGLGHLLHLVDPVRFVQRLADFEQTLP